MADPALAQAVVEQVVKRDDERLKFVRWFRRRASERQGIPLDPDDSTPPKMPEARLQPVPVEVSVKHTHETTTTTPVEPGNGGGPGGAERFDWCRLAALLLLALGTLLLVLLGMALAGFWAGDTTVITPDQSESLLQWLEDGKKHLP